MDQPTENTGNKAVITEAKVYINGPDNHQCSRVGGRNMTVIKKRPTKAATSHALKSVLSNPIRTVRKDHKGHKDRRILTEANEANEELSNAKPNLGRKPFRYLGCLV
jgi:hypothetical protein